MNERHATLRSRPGPDRHLPRIPSSAFLGVFLVLTGVYLATASFRVETIDTGVRLEVARAIASNGSPAIAPLEMRTPFGIVGSFEGRDGRHYSVYGLGQSLLMLPFALLGEPLDTRLVPLLNPLAGAAACALLVGIVVALGFSRVAGIRVALLVGLATLVWPQSKFTFEAPLEMLAAVTAFALVLRGGPKATALAGTVFGFALLTRPSAVLMLPGLAILMGASRPWGRPKPGFLRSAGLFALGAAPWIALFLFYNWFRWGSPFASGYALTRFRYFGPSWESLVGLIASPGRGFFWYSPVLLLGFAGFPALRRAAPVATGAILATAASYLIFLCLTTVWNGDWTWGPRHLLPIVPLLGLFLAPVLEARGRTPSRRRKLPRGIVLPVVAVSVLVQLVGLSVSYEAYYLWHNDQVLRHGLREKAGDYHFDPARSQIWVELRQSLLYWGSLRERTASWNPARDGHPYGWILEGSPRITKRVPDVWWVYLPMLGVSPPVTIALLALCFAVIGAGTWLLVRPPGGARDP